MSQTATLATVRTPVTEDLDSELTRTRRMLEAVPDEHWGWKPHDRSMSLGRIANHIIEAMGLVEAVARRDSFDLTEERGAESPDREALLRRFDAQADALRAGVAARNAKGWDGAWQLTRGGAVMWTMPRAVAFRVLISHVVHHRGQLSLFLRLLDVPVPGMYGPSADERGR
jgi:uncharacterized damage-inducible protein DinB